MKKGTIKMTMLGRTLTADLIDGDSPTRYKARYFPYEYDEAEVDRALNGIKGIKRQAQRLGIQKGGRVRGKARKPWKVEISGHLHKDSREEDGNKDDFSIKIFQKCISNLDAAKRKGEIMEEALDLGNERKKRNLRELGDDKAEKQPSPNGDQNMEADPKSKEKAMDQQEGPP